MPVTHRFCVPRFAPALFGLTLLAFLLIARPGPCHAASDTPRERVSFNAGWRFLLGEPNGSASDLDYASIRAWVLPSAADFIDTAGGPPSRLPSGEFGQNLPYIRPDFDDHAWRLLDLPHDWAVERAFEQKLPGSTGKLRYFGVGWYRKTFDFSAAEAGHRISLEIDGAQSNALVWCNGRFAGGWPYGYASWSLDLTPYLKPGEKNVVAIRLSNPEESSRWYPGAGIYRNVWLTTTAPVHVAHWGNFVTTPRVSTESALVAVETQVKNDTASEASVQVGWEIYALDASGNKTGAVVAASRLPTNAKIAAGRRASLSSTLMVDHPRLWSLKAPQRYVMVATVTSGGKTADVAETSFGIRTCVFDPERGFFLNGEHVPIQGVCNHHDLGALGAAFNLRAAERQLEILQAMGCNAIRTSHNPPAPELLELCDRMGFLVMDEAFDMWHSAKNKDDYHLAFPDWHEADLCALVRRDRNHPSIILWSIGNEVREQGEPEGWKVAAHLAAIVHEEDRTRPVTTACNNVASGFNGFQNAVDVLGYNYASRNPPDWYGRFHTESPHIPVLGSETSSAVSSRGEYFFPVSNDKNEGRANFQVSSYDLYAPRWAAAPDDEFRMLEEFPFVAGEFVWTGFDYLGEPTPYNSDSTNLLNFTDPAQKERAAKDLAELKRIPVPSRSAYFGIIDLAGFPKDRYYLYQSRWRPDLPMVHILPHWNWPERVGQVTPVHVYTSGDEAELFLNGQSLGRKKKAPLTYRLRWDDVKYAPGELHVIAYKNGQKWSEATTKTTGTPSKLLLVADRTRLFADGQDLSYVTVTVADADGLMVPRANNKIVFDVAGPAEIVAVDNGDPTNLESFRSAERNAFNGLCLAIVRAKKGQSGPITLTARADGLAVASLQLESVGPR